MYTLRLQMPPCKICYDRLNVSNCASQNVWVKKGANSRGPKKIWIPRSTPIVFDIGMALTRHEMISALVVDAIGTRWTNQWMHHYQRV